MNDDNFDGSFKIYVDSKNNDIETGRAGPGNEPYGLEKFRTEVENVKEDMANVEKLYNKLQESNEEIKMAECAKDMKDLRVRMNTDLDYIIKLAKQINRKYDGLVRGNAAQRKVEGSGPGSSDDQTRTSMIAELGENIKHMMRKFQGLRAQMESEHRQLIESRYFAMTREKATAEAIDNLIINETAESPLHHAMQEHGRAPVLDTVAEIQERRDTLREIRKNMMGLHQILLGIASPVVPSEGHGYGARARGPPSPIDAQAPPLPQAVVVAPKVGAGQLNDYERETRKQAYIAIAIAIIIIIAVITPLLIVENQLEGTSDT